MDKLKLIRYSGAKTQFTDDINLVINKWKASTYVEAFLGSGAVFLNLSNQLFSKYYINDIDRNVIHVFKTFKEIDYSYFKDKFKFVMNKFGDIGKSKNSYMNFRNWFNETIWNTNTKEEGVFIMILSCACINSFFRFGKKGFASSYGERNLAKNYDEYNHTFIKKRLNQNVSISNLDFFEFIKLVETEEKDNIDITLFVDPPYILTGKAGYADKFVKSDYDKFLDYIKSTKYNVAYTDVYSKDLNWKTLELRRTMKNTGPSTDKFDNGLREVIYYNK